MGIRKSGWAIVAGQKWMWDVYQNLEGLTVARFRQHLSSHHYRTAGWEHRSAYFTTDNKTMRNAEIVITSGGNFIDCDRWNIPPALEQEFMAKARVILAKEQL